MSISTKTLILTLSFLCVLSYPVTAQTISNQRFGVVKPSPKSIANGNECTSDADCKSGYCYPGPSANTLEKFYCLAKEKNCAFSGSDGYMFKEKVSYKGGNFECSPAQVKDQRARWIIK